MLPANKNDASVFLAGQLSGNTRRAYERDLCEFFQIGALERITVEMVKGVTLEQVVCYRNMLLDKYKPATVARRMSALRSFFDYCCSIGLLRTNPATSKLARSPRVDNESTKAGLTRQEAELLLKQPDKNTLAGKRDFALLLLLITAGLRRSEVVAVKKSDFMQIDRHYVLNVTGKGMVPAQIKIQPRTYTAVFDYCSLHDSDYVFLNRFGRRMSDVAVWRIVEKYINQAGIEKQISPHSLRHTFVTLAIDGGAELHKVQVAARHASPKTTMRYYRNKQNLDNNAIDYIDILY